MKIFEFFIILLFWIGLIIIGVFTIIMIILATAIGSIIWIPYIIIKSLYELIKICFK